MSETFTETMRRIDDADLDVYQYRMIMHIWRVGLSWESVRTLAEKCHMSPGKAHQTKTWLIENGWLSWTVANNGRMALRVCSPDEQIQQFVSPHEHAVSPHEHAVSPHEHPVSPHERHLKKDLLNEPIEERPNEGEEKAPAGTDREWLEFFKINNIPKPADEREWSYLRHPASLIWLQATSYWPSYKNLPYLIAELGEAADEAILARAYELWRASGNKPSNVVGVVDWYKELLRDPAWVPGKRFSQNGKSSQSAYERSEAAIEAFINS